MQKKYIFNVGLIAALLVAGFVVLNNPGQAAAKNAPAEPATPAPATCCEKNIQQKCTEGSIKTESPANLENLSHQFISLPGFIR